MIRLSSFFLLLFAALPILAGSPATTEPNWAWTTEERIARRLDPRNIHDRVEDYATRTQSLTGKRGVASSSVTESPTFVIDGRFDAGLFMPWELMERFLNITDAGALHREAIRERYTDDIAAFGWGTTSFWRDLDDISTQYVALRNEIREVASAVDREPTAKALESRTDETRLPRTGQAPSPRKDLKDEFCFIRAQALERARERFGRDQFERFLYEVVAPGVMVFSDDPMTAEQLRRLEEGCQ